MSVPPFSFVSCLRILFFSLIGAFVTVSASAAVLYLSNGDHVSGEFLRRLDGRIYFRSPFLGEISVPESQGAVVESPDTPVESLAGLPPANASALPNPVSDGPNGRTSAYSSARTGARPPWHGKIEFGFQQQSGRNDALNFSLRAEAEKKKGANDYRAEGRVLYGRQNGIVDTDRNNADFRWRHELSERIFSQSETSYTQDRVKLINSDYEQNVGFGYRLLQRRRDTANVGAGLTGQYRKLTQTGATTSVLVQMFEDYSYKLNGRLTLVQDASVLSALKDTNNYTLLNDQLTQTDGKRQNYRFRFNSALQGKITEKVSMNLRFEYEFDNALVQPSARADNRITTSLGYGF